MPVNFGTMIIVRVGSHFASKDFIQWSATQPLAGYIPSNWSIFF